MYSVGVLSRFSRCVTHRRFLETITPLLEEVWNASAGIHIRVECVEYVAGIRDIASIARDDAAGKKRNSSRAHNRWGELETSFFVLSSQFRPRRLVLGRQIVETIPIPSPPPPSSRFAGIDGTGSILRVSLSSVEIGHRRMFS